MTAEHFVRYEVDSRVAVITLDRPQAANAQTAGVLADLDEAWRRADADPEVRVIVFNTTGKHFSAGHDMSGVDPSANGRSLGPPRTDGKLDAPSYYDWETRGYLDYARRWREIPKPTIAAVQGKCIAAGLMLCWPCDLIVAADNAQFTDPVALLGIMGVEFHAHTWELGARKAKEMLFTAGPVSAQEALSSWGWSTMSSRWTNCTPSPWSWRTGSPRTIRGRLRLAKRAVNQTLDTMGFSRPSRPASTCTTSATPAALAATGGQPSS